MSEEKVYTSMYSRNAELYHHGVKGQKWGVENGPPYPLSDEISTGRRLKKVEKLQEKSEKNRGYMKKHEDYYDNKTKKENEKVDKKADKKIEKINKKREFKKEVNETQNYMQLHLNDRGYKYAKEDALKAEIKMKKLLAKENGGKYRYKDMTDEEKEYYRKSVEKKIGTAAWVTLVAASAAAGAYEMHEAKRGDDYSDYGINRRPSKSQLKEGAEGQLKRAKEAKYGSLRKDYAKYSENSTRSAKILKENRDTNIKQIDRKIEWAKRNKTLTNPKIRTKSNSELDKEIEELEKEKERIKKYYDKKIKEAETSAIESYNMARGRGRL